MILKELTDEYKYIEIFINNDLIGKYDKATALEIFGSYTVIDYSFINVDTITITLKIM